MAKPKKFKQGEKPGDYTCINCGSSEIKIHVHLNMSIPPNAVGNLTKRALRKEESQINFVQWDSATISCTNCGTFERNISLL